MRTCPKCGSPLKEGEMYCFNCGEKIRSVTAGPSPEDFRREGMGIEDERGFAVRENSLPDMDRDMERYRDDYNSPADRENARPVPDAEIREPAFERPSEVGRDNREGSKYEQVQRGPESNDPRQRQYVERPQQGFPPEAVNGQQMPYPPYPQQQQPTYPPQMPPQQPQPEKKRGGFLSRLGKVLEIIIYIIFIAAAIGAILMLKNFADSVNWGLL